MDAVGTSLIPLYRFLGPIAVIVILVLFVTGVVKTVLDVVISPVHTAVTRMSTTSRLIRCFMNGNGGDRTIRVTAPALSHAYGPESEPVAPRTT